VAEAVEDIVGVTEEVTEEVILGIVRIEGVAGEFSGLDYKARKYFSSS